MTSTQPETLVVAIAVMHDRTPTCGSLLTELTSAPPRPRASRPHVLRKLLGTPSFAFFFALHQSAPRRIRVLRVWYVCIHVFFWFHDQRSLAHYGTVLGRFEIRKGEMAPIAQIQYQEGEELESSIPPTVAIGRRR